MTRITQYVHSCKVCIQLIYLYIAHNGTKYMYIFKRACSYQL